MHRYRFTSAKGTLHNTLLIITFAQLITKLFFHSPTIHSRPALATSLYAHIKRILNLNEDGMVIFVFLPNQKVCLNYNCTSTRFKTVFRALALN